MAKLLVFPMYRSNPYQNMLYLGARAEGWSVSGQRKAVSVIADIEKLSAGDILHIHWTQPITKQKTRQDSAKLLKTFRKTTLAALQRGARLIWTVHNATAHDSLYLDLEIELAQFLAANAWKIIQINPETRAVVADLYELPAEKLVTLRHASYLGVYPPAISRAAAREILGVAPDVPVVGFVGQMKPYKGIDTLLTAMSAVCKDNPETTLLLAGKANRREQELIAAAMPDNVPLIKTYEYVSDEDMPIWFGAADVLVFPYRNILNSGSALAAAAFARRCILPGEKHLIPSYAGQDWVSFFDPDDPVPTLAAAIQNALAKTDGDALDALEYARSYTTYDMTWDYVRLLAEEA